MTHSTIALHPASCTSCMLCVRECPDWCITVQAHTEPDPDAPAYSNSRRQATKNVLDQFTIDFGQCMWCGICIDVCPFDALFWSDSPNRRTTKWSTKEITSGSSCIELRNLDQIHSAVAELLANHLDSFQSREVLHPELESLRSLGLHRELAC